MKTVVLIAFILLIIPTLSGQDGNKSKLTVLNLEEAFSRQQEVPLSRFVDKITYISLETNPQALITGLAYYEVTDEFIIVRTLGDYQILLFDRKTGKFIREIGKQGRGPGEFSIYSVVPFNSVKKEIYALSYSGDLLTYDLSGRNIDKIKLPKWTDPDVQEGRSIRFPINNMLDENIFVGYFQNFYGWEKRKLVLLTKEEVIKIFPNYLTYKGIRLGPVQYQEVFFEWERKLYFIEAFCDTLYQITRDLLIPRFFFDWGKYNAPYSKQNVIDRRNYFVLKDINENKNYIFFRCGFLKEDYTGFIDKRNNNVTFCKPGASGISALEDDISGLMDVLPMDFTQNNEMIFAIQPVKLINWLKENPEKATQARNKLPWLKNIDEFSNPIIAIGKCKD